MLARTEAVFSRLLETIPAMKGLAAVSSEPSPLPMMKMAAQKPPNDLALMAGMEIMAPRA
jgi:hypothetical protein